jgi:hypothetical protein
MESLSARELLRAWEQGLARHNAERGLLLLGAACPDLDREALSSLTIGERDHLLFRFREQMFGSALVAVVLCPKCGERIELAFRTADVVRERLTSPAELIDVQVVGYSLRLRLLTCSDLAAAGGLHELEAARDFLLERSIVSIERDGQPVPLGEVPAHVIDFVSEQMTEADPMATIQLGVTCSACAHCWNEILDITSFLWTEIEGWANRTLHDVHRLASAYGWSESEILGMSAWRRHCYLRLIGK